MSLEARRVEIKTALAEVIEICAVEAERSNNVQDAATRIRGLVTAMVHVSSAVKEVAAPILGDQTDALKAT